MRLCYIGPAASVTLRRWVEWFTARGHDATVITVEPAEPKAAGAFRQIDVGSRLGPRKLGRILSAARAVLAVRRLNPDVVHAHYLRGLAWGLLLHQRVPYVATPWGSDVLEEQQAFREWYCRPLTRRLIGGADLVTVHSEYMREQIRRLHPSAGPVVRIGRGVNLRRFRPGLDVGALRARWEIGEDARVIFSPRLAKPFYNHDVIMKALPSVQKQFPKAMLIMTEHWADPAYIEDLRRLAARLGVLDQIRFVGDLPYSDMPLWYNLADVVVMMPLSDGMPNSLLEAMACGTVPILARLPQYAEVVQDGVTGRLVEREERDLAEAIVGVLDDSALKADMEARNLAYVSEMGDQDREMSRMEDWYHKLASHSHIRGGEEHA